MAIELPGGTVSQLITDKMASLAKDGLATTSRLPLLSFSYVHMGNSAVATIVWVSIRRPTSR